MKETEVIFLCWVEALEYKEIEGEGERKGGISPGESSQQWIKAHLAARG